MAYKVTNPAKFWEGGGGGGSFGTIKWFGAAEPVPDGWEPADGGGLSRVTHERILKALGVNGRGWRLAVGGSFSWRNTSTPLFPVTKNLGTIIGNYYVYQMVSQSGGSNKVMIYRKMLNRNWNGAEADLPSIQLDGEYSRAWGYVPEDGLFYLLGSSHIYSKVPLEPTNTAMQLTTAGFNYGGGSFPNSQGEMVKVGTNYLIGTQTDIKRHAEGQPWQTWTQVLPAGMTYPVADTFRAVIDGVVNCVIVDKDSYVWITSDGVTFTKKLTRLPGTQGAASQKPAQLAFDGVDTFWYRNQQSGLVTLWKSSDLETWTEVTGTVIAPGGRYIKSIGGGDGFVVLGYATNGGATAPVFAYSPDKGATWIYPVLSGYATFGYYDVDHCLISGAGVVCFQWSGSNANMTMVELDSKKPLYQPLSRDGVTYKAYMKVL